MWQKAKRAVSAETARGIAAVAREHGAKAVGVFVDEDAAAIVSRQAGGGLGWLAHAQGRAGVWARACVRAHTHTHTFWGEGR